ARAARPGRRARRTPCYKCLIRVTLAILLAPSLAVAKPVKIGDATLSVNVGDTLDSLELAIERKGHAPTTIRGWDKLAPGKPAPFVHCELLAASVDAQRLGKRTG